MKAKGCPSYDKMDPSPQLEASHFKKKVLLKSNMASTCVVCMASLRFEKSYFVVSCKETTFFFRNDVKGVAILKSLE